MSDFTDKEKAIFEMMLEQMDPISLIQMGAARMGWLIGMGQEPYTMGLALGTQDWFDMYMEPDIQDAMTILEHQAEPELTEEEVN